MLQMKLMLALKDNDLSRETQTRLEIKKELEKEQHQVVEMRAQIDTLKNTVKSLHVDVTHLTDIKDEQRVSVVFPLYKQCVS